MDRLTTPDEPIEGGMRRAAIDVRAVKEQAMTMYWRLKKYEDTGLTPRQLIEMDRLYTEMCREVQRYRWIPVEDRLPAPGDTVLAYIKHNYAEDGWRAYMVYKYTDHWVGMGNLCEVLAWMPLPASSDYIKPANCEECREKPSRMG